MNESQHNKTMQEARAWLGDKPTRPMIDPVFQNLLMPLKAEELDILEQSLLAEGCRDALLTWQGTLIDGHNRLAICEKHGIPYQVKEQFFDGRAAVLSWIANNQLGRRNYNDAQRIDLHLKLKDALAEIGRENMRLSDGPGKKGLSKVDRPLEPHDTRAEIAAAAKVSTGTMGRAEVVKKRAPELWEQAKEGVFTIGGAYKELRRRDKIETQKKKIEEIKTSIEQGNVDVVQGCFDVIVIDPPWPYGRRYDPETSRVANPYPEMSIDEIAEIELPLADDAVVFLWTTHAFIKDAFALLEKWGLKYKAIITWDKEKMGMGATIRMQCEFCLLAFKGRPVFMGESTRDIIRESRREHSRKPDMFYKIVEDITVGRKLDYFAREKRNGWTVYGAEVEKF